MAPNVHVFMLVWHLKNVRPATELVLKTDLHFYLEHLLKRSPPDDAWLCKNADCPSVAPRLHKTACWVPPTGRRVEPFLANG